MQPLVEGLQLHIILFLLFFCVRGTLSQSPDTTNRIVDERYPLIFSYDDGDNNSFTHFGATVALSQGPLQDGNPSSWVFIGAPTGRVNDKSNQTGVLWRCSIGLEQDALKPKSSSSLNEVCKIINIDPLPSSTSKRRGWGSPVLEETENMWTGVGLEISEGRLVICGHRHTRGGGTYMNGLCYFLLNKTTGVSNVGPSSYVDYAGPIIQGYSHRLLPFFVPDENNGKDQNFNFENANNETGHEWAYGQVGTSLHIPKGRENILVLGAPGARMWSGAVVRYKDNATATSGRSFRLNRDKNSPIYKYLYSELLVAHRGKKVQENGHWFELFGYALTSGKYFDKDVTVYAGGSPRGDNLSGDVVIFDFGTPTNSEETYKRQINTILTVSPTSDAFGSYFGSVLYSVDVDGDGRDELFVGSPYFTLGVLRTRAKRGAGDEGFLKGEEWTGDNGCVFVYFFTPNKEINGSVHRIQSPDIPAPGGARFGSAISHIQWINTRDNKLMTYIIIGAPNEDKGQGAIYIFHYVNREFELVQKVLASETLNTGTLLKGFGSSISTPQDVDSNGTPDFAVGAYGSGQAFVFRTRAKAFIKGMIIFRDKSRTVNDGKVLRTSTSLTIESCITVYQEVGKILDMEVYVSVTLLKQLNFANIYPWMVKLSNVSYLYTEKVSLNDMNSKTACREFEVIPLNTKSEAPKQYEIDQSFWYNATSTGTSIFEYKIQSGNTTKLGRGKLQDFQPNLPNHIQRTTAKFLAEFAPNCSMTICYPSLNIETSWFLDLEKKPVTEIILESTKEIVFQLKIYNSNETAIKPNLEIEWIMDGVEVNRLSERILAADNFLLQKSNCQEISTSNMIRYNCTFSEDINTNETIVLQIPLSFKDFYATQSKEDFKIHYSVKPQDATYPITNSSFLTLNANSKISLLGSKSDDILRSSTEQKGTNQTATNQIENDFVSWKQSYWVRIDGPSNAIVKLQLAFPHTKILNDGTASNFIRITGRSDNSYCKPDREHHANSNNGIGQQNVDYDEQRGSEIGGFERSSNSHKPSAPLDFTSGVTETKPLRHFPENVQLLTQNALLIKCDNDVSLVGFSCLQFNCEIKMVGGSSVELGFELEMKKDEIDALLSLVEKTEVLVVSYGYAEIFGGTLVVNDTAQTYFKPPFHSSVGLLVYVLSIIFGLLVLVVISYVLYKCGFFKRKEKEKLQMLKSETRQSVILSKPGADENIQNKECATRI